MTTTYGRSCAGVRRWPDDPDVRRTLEEYLDYLDKLPNGSRPVESQLNGMELDFRGSESTHPVMTFRKRRSTG